MRTAFNATLVVLALLGALLSGCQSESVDVSGGNYGKADTTTKLPPQPNPQDIARSRAANPNQGMPNAK